MCTGAELLLVSGTAVNIYGTLKKGNDEKRYYDTQAALQEKDAEAEEQAALSRAGKIRKAGQFQRSEARAAFGASGVQVGQGTAETVEKSIVQFSEEDALNEILTGQRTATSLRDQAGLSRQAGKNAKRASQYEAFGSLLQSGSTAQKWKTA